MTKQLLPVPFITPAFSGLNKARAASTNLGPEWALELQNCVFDLSGRIASRSGWVKQNTSAVFGAGGFDFSQTVLLLHSDGTNASTTFIDSSSYAHTITVNGNAQLTTSNKKFGTAAGVYDGTGDYLSAPNGTEFDFATGDFTIELWVYAASAGASTTRGLVSKVAFTSVYPYQLLIDINNKLSVNCADGTGTTQISITDAVAITNDTWVHVAFTRSGSSFRLFKDGVQVGSTGTFAGVLGANTAAVVVGATGISGSSGANGGLDEVRLIKGTALYTSAFAPPTSAPADFSTGFAPVNQIAEYIKADATTVVVSAANLKLYSGTTTLTDITGSVTPTTDDWQFQNFNDFILGFQVGKTPISWAGSGNFVTITPTSGSAPTGGAAIAAFGRVWGVDADNNTIKYCGLLDHLNWGAAGSGSINMRSIWTRGTDQVVGLAAVGATLVVFGKRHIVLFTDGRGSTLGLDPATMYVVDTVEGTGLVGRDTVAPIGDGDLLYLSPTGVQSLSRTIQNKNNPLTSVDQHVRDYVRSFTAGETPSKLRAVYNAAQQFYLLILPISGKCFCYDTKAPLQDGSLRVTEWNSIAPKCAAFRANNTMLTGQNGYIGLYSGFSDNGASYQFVYTSPNVYITEQAQAFLKILKRIGSIVFTTSTSNLTYQWGFDFEGFSGQSTQTVQGGNIPEYGSAEYGANGKYSVLDTSAVAGVNFSEYGGGLALRIVKVPGSGAGRWIQIGLTAAINGSELAIQQLDIYSKIGGME